VETVQPDLSVLPNISFSKSVPKSMSHSFSQESTPYSFSSSSSSLPSEPSLNQSFSYPVENIQYPLKTLKSMNFDDLTSKPSFADSSFLFQLLDEHPLTVSHPREVSTLENTNTLMGEPFASSENVQLGYPETADSLSVPAKPEGIISSIRNRKVRCSNGFSSLPTTSEIPILGDRNPSLSKAYVNYAHSLIHAPYPEFRMLETRDASIQTSPMLSFNQTTASDFQIDDDGKKTTTSSSSQTSFTFQPELLLLPLFPKKGGVTKKGGGSSIAMVNKKPSSGSSHSFFNKNNIAIGTDSEFEVTTPLAASHSTPSAVAASPFFVPFLSSPLQGYDSASVSTFSSPSVSSAPSHILHQKRSLPHSSLSKSSTSEMFKEDDEQETTSEISSNISPSPSTNYSIQKRISLPVTPKPCSPLFQSIYPLQEYTEVHVRAATIIQSTWRMHLTSSAFRYIRSCAVIIQRAWRNHRQHNSLIAVAVEEKLKLMLNDRNMIEDLRKNENKKRKSVAAVEDIDCSIPANPINTIVYDDSLLARFKAVVSLSMFLFV
jgi:hypothetical protein